jgi:hypothetical protein
MSVGVVGRVCLRRWWWRRGGRVGPHEGQGFLLLCYLS